MNDLTAEAISTNIRALNRNPFQDELIKILGAAPTIEQLKEYAGKYPHRWADMVKTFAPLAGYQDKVTVGEINIYQQINHLPDSQLLELLNKTLKEIQVGELIEAD